MAEMTADAPRVPPVFGYYGGEEVFFIHTETSDPAIASTLEGMMGSPVPVVESLAETLEDARSAVYAFTNGVVPDDTSSGPLGFAPDVFDSAPGDEDYTPLRELMLVTWSAELGARVAAEWATTDAGTPGELVGWRTARTLYELRLPTRGWWVRLEDPDSMAAAERAIPAQLAAAGGPLDVGVLRGRNRTTTVLLADWVRGLRLDDGSQPLGVHYDSRYATGAGWAYWMRRVEDGHDASSEPLQVLGEHPIDISDPDLATIAHRFGISIT